MTIRGEILDASDQDASLTLREAIRRTSDGHPQSGAPAAGIVNLLGRHERPLAVILVAVQPPPHSVDSTALVALLIPEGEVGRQRSRHLLRDLYRLTEREADVAADLLQGLSVNDIARHRGLSVHTVRTRLKRLLEKTRTTRQPELLSLLVASFPPVEHR